MSLESSTQSIIERVGEDCGLEASLKFNMGDDGVIYVDATVVPNVVSNEDKAADCTVDVTLEDFESMIAGDLAPTTAFMSGKIKVDNVGVAMKLQSIL